MELQQFHLQRETHTITPVLTHGVVAALPALQTFPGAPAKPRSCSMLPPLTSYSLLLQLRDTTAHVHLDQHCFGLLLLEVAGQHSTKLLLNNWPETMKLSRQKQVKN